MLLNIHLSKYYIWKPSLRPAFFSFLRSTPHEFQSLSDFREKQFANSPEANQILYELIASYVHPKNSNHLRSHLRAIMALDHRRLIRPGKEIRPNFLLSTSLVYKILPTNLGVCKPTLYTIYISHLRWTSTMRHCFYHTDLEQNAIFHNFAIQIALIQYSGRPKHAWTFR